MAQPVIPELSMEVTESGLKVKTRTPEGAVSSKYVSVQDLQAAFARNVSFDTGLLPIGVRMYRRHNEREEIFFELPPEIRKVKWSNGNEYTVPIPWTLWYIYLQTDPSGMKMHARSSVFAMKGTIIGNKLSRVFRFPFCNVDSYICWGHTKLPLWKDLTGITSIPDLFFGANFNGDLDHEKFKPFKTKIKGQNVEIYGTHSLFKHLDGKEEFPEDILIDIGNFADICQRYISRR